MRGRVALRRSQFPFLASVGQCFPPGFCGSASRSVDATAGALSCALLAPACQPLTLGHIHDGASPLCWRCPEMLARRDTRREAARLRRLSPLQTLENQSQTWGIRCHSCTGREGLPPSWKLSYKTEVLRFTRESRFSFNQRIARILMYHPKLGMTAITPRAPICTEYWLAGWRIRTKRWPTKVLVCKPSQLALQATTARPWGA